MTLANVNRARMDHLGSVLAERSRITPATAEYVADAYRKIEKRVREGAYDALTERQFLAVVTRTLVRLSIDRTRKAKGDARKLEHRRSIRDAPAGAHVLAAWSADWILGLFPIPVLYERKVREKTLRRVAAEYGLSVSQVRTAEADQKKEARSRYGESERFVARRSHRLADSAECTDVCASLGSFSPR